MPRKTETKYNKCVCCGANVAPSEVECDVCKSARTLTSKYSWKSQEGGLTKMGIEEYVSGVQTYAPTTYEKTPTNLHLITARGTKNFDYGGDKIAPLPFEEEWQRKARARDLLLRRTILDDNSICGQDKLEKTIDG